MERNFSKMTFGGNLTSINDESENSTSKE